MYLRVPGVLQAGSKESFMLLLDFAEANLGCAKYVLYTTIYLLEYKLYKVFNS